MEGSLHLKGQVVTPHQTKQREVYGTDIQILYHTSIPRQENIAKEELA